MDPSVGKAREIGVAVVVEGRPERRAAEAGVSSPVAVSAAGAGTDRTGVDRRPGSAAAAVEIVPEDAEPSGAAVPSCDDLEASERASVAEEVACRAAAEDERTSTSAATAVAECSRLRSRLRVAAVQAAVPSAAAGSQEAAAAARPCRDASHDAEDGAAADVPCSSSASTGAQGAARRRTTDEACPPG